MLGGGEESSGPPPCSHNCELRSEFLVWLVGYTCLTPSCLQRGTCRDRDPRRWGKREIIYLSLHCHHLNDSCIKMGSDGSHFNVSLIVRDKITRQCPQTTTFEEKGEPKRIVVFL